MNEILLYLLAQVNGNSLPKANLGPSMTSVLRLVFMGAALLSVIFVAIGGLKYSLSSGDPQGMAKAKNTVLYAIIGLVIAISAFVIVGFVASRI